MTTGKNCIVHLEKSLLSEDAVNAILSEVDAANELERKARQAIQKKRETISDRADARVEAMDLPLSATELRGKVKEQIEMKLEKELQKIHDTYVAAKTAKSDLEGARNELDVLKNRGNRIYGKASMDTYRRVYANELRNELTNFENLFGASKDKGLAEIRNNPDFEKSVYKKVIELEKIELENVEAVAKEIAKSDDLVLKTAHAIKAYNEYSRRFMAHNGIPTKYRQNYVTRRRYDWGNVEKMGPDGFRDFMKQHLDHEATFGKGVTAKDVDEALKMTYDSFKQNDRAKVDAFGVNDAKSITARNHARKFVFKDADSDYAVFREMSNGDLATQMEQNTWGMATFAMKVKELGYDHVETQKMYAQAVENNIERIGDTVRGKVEAKLGEGKVVGAGLSKVKGSLQKTAVVYQKHRIQQAIADFTGDNYYAPSMLSTASSMARMAVNIGKLGNAVTTAMLDPLDTARQVFYFNGEAFSGFMQYQRNFKDAMNMKLGTRFGNNKEASRQMLHDLNQHLGLVTHFISSDSSMRMARGDLASASGSNISEKINKYGSKAMEWATLLPQQTEISKIASAVTGAQNFVKSLDKVNVVDGKANLKGLNKYEIDSFREYGIGAKDLVMLKEVERVKGFGGGDGILSGKNIRDHLLFGDQDRVMKGLGIAQDEVSGYAIELAAKYDAYLNDFFSRGTPTPELASKTALLKASKSEISNTFIGLLTQFMDTPLMQLQSTLELKDKLLRINGLEHGSVGEIIKTIGPDALAHAAPHAIAGSAMYLMYDMLWSAAMGKDSKVAQFAAGDMQERKGVMLDVLGRTSVLPFAFEILDNQTSKYHNVNAFNTVGGPALGIATDLANALNPSSSKTIGGFMKKHAPNPWAVQMIKNRWNN